MFKKNTVLISVILALFMSLSLFACSTIEYKSAYDLACEYGFVGSEQEWLDSLKGSDGADGEDGRDGIDGKDGGDGTVSSIDIYDLYDAYILVHEGATFEEFLEAYMIVETENLRALSVAKAMQSIVSINSTFSMMINRPGQSTSTDYSAAGSGVVYKIEGEDVYIITNYHVIYDRSSNNTQNGIAKTIEIFTYGQSESSKAVSAEFLGGSITKDIAVLKASLADFSSDIRPVDTSDSNNIALSKGAMAIGNPMGEGISVTYGVVSVDSEEIEMEALDSASKIVIMRVLRVDTAINGGNSGGGLFNSSGELIGIVNAKIIETGIENVGYAIPVNVAIGIAESVLTASAKKCVMGIVVEAITTRTHYSIEDNKVEIIETLSVESVSEGSISYGILEVGDILKTAKIADNETLVLTRVFHLSDYLYKARHGDSIILEIERNGEALTIELTADQATFSDI